MTSIMNQVTCSLCDVKIDESQWKEHLISTDHLKRCKEEKGGITTKFFELIFNTYQSRKNIYNLKDEKTLDFWQSYFATKLPKEKFDILCKDSNNDSELENSLTSDLLYFMNECEHDFENSCFEPLDKVIRCRICFSDVHQSCLFEHIVSNERRDTDNYFINKCMTYCERCYKEIKNDEWTQHLLSDSHLSGDGEKYCNICEKKYRVTNTNGVYSPQLEINHYQSDIHNQNKQRSQFLL